MNSIYELTILLTFLCTSFVSVRVDLIPLSTIFRLTMFLLPILVCKRKKKFAVLSVFTLSLCIFLNHAIICILSSKANEYYYILKLECGLIDIGIVFVFFILSVLNISENQKKICKGANSVKDLKFNDKKELENYTYMIFISSLAFIISVLWDCNFQLFYKTVSILALGIVVNYIYYKSTINYVYSNAYNRLSKYCGDMFYDEWK